MTEREQKYFELEKKMRPYAARIFDGGRFDEMDKNIQHGKTTTKQHVMNVADISMKLGDALHIQYSKGELVRFCTIISYTIGTSAQMKKMVGRNLSTVFCILILL